MRTLITSWSCLCTLGKYNQDTVTTCTWALVFCSTSVPLTSTRWVQTTIKLFCTVHSLSSALSLNLSNIKKFRNGKNLGNAENRTRAGWLWRAYTTSVLCRPPTIRFFSSWPFDICSRTFQSKGLRPDAMCPCAASAEGLTVSIRRPGREGANATGR